MLQQVVALWQALQIPEQALHRLPAGPQICGAAELRECLWAAHALHLLEHIGCHIHVPHLHGRRAIRHEDCACCFSDALQSCGDCSRGREPSKQAIASCQTSTCNGPFQCFARVPIDLQSVSMAIIWGRNQGGTARRDVLRSTMRFGSTGKVLAKCMLKYYRISE